MKLINLGFGRTGTTSLKAALERIGYAPCFHTTDLLTSTDNLDVWEAAGRGETTNWQVFFKDYAVADWPAALHWRDILAAHPTAKVMISVRDPDAWHGSMMATLAKLDAIHLPIPRLKRAKAFMYRTLDTMFDGRLDDRAYATQVFKQHIADVQATVPTDNLLVYQVTEGWEPLCTFLGVDVPDEPFPRDNRRENFRALATRIFGRAS